MKFLDANPACEGKSWAELEANGGEPGEQGGLAQEETRHDRRPLDVLRRSLQADARPRGESQAQIAACEFRRPHACARTW